MKYQAKNMFLGVAFFSAFLAGCASTDTDGSGQEGADSVSTYTESTDSMNDSYNTDDMANLETVFYFEFDQATLTVKARQALDAQIARLKKTTGPVRLEGHADERGTREYNIALGERRAISVADYMAINGIPRYRIETVSYGEERPVAFGQSESTYSQNRRVELK
ncbi:MULTISPECIES: OmpA family protein [Zhongshania]|jgi:peptidoglycan-associated lipoprotein|uniref:OmpA family protein n=1 Tax=Zhongshania aquimaris TaxID=2857107 RepID=A0ABS6VXF3_9GAMM|nr:MULTISPECIES: OmpA family protein [Zhongshania]MBQ0796064.1 OmpA family protein [Zhongshania sp.]MBW2942370.1 OmpA family protein [Zhongshania aquimaris]|tara:strand:- start:2955 stop:3449 length:495 start_codon:yes stop_codon:yes gene_type:complete